MKYRIYPGLALIAFSFLSFFPNTFPQHKLLLAALFYLGVIYLSEGITYAFTGTSLLHEIRRSWHNTLTFVFVATAGGLLLDGVAKFLGKLWIYPDWSPTFYALIFIPGFAAYWLTIAESYLAAKTLLDYAHKGTRSITKSYRFERAFYSVIGILGVLFAVGAILLLLSDYVGQPLSLFTPENVYSSAISFRVAFSEILLLFLGTWFIFEWIEFSRKKTSLLKDIVHQYYTPLLAIIIGSFVNSIFMEAQNIPSGLWRYTNWPLEYLAIFGVPIIALLVWPLHYVTFLSLFRATTDKESNLIWQADRIP